MSAVASQPFDTWFRVMKPNPTASLRLYCFAHAGGAANAFFTWPGQLPDVEVVAVRLPGRESRMSEPLLEVFDDAVEAITTAIEPGIHQPYAFFGHSLGALMAYEVAQRTTAAGHPPRCLIVAGRRAPHMPAGGPPIGHLADDAFAVEIQRQFDNIPEAIRSNPELLQFFMRIVRADMRLVESYTHRPHGPLSCPIHMYGGERDTSVDAEHLRAWAEHTTGETTFHMVDGDHFFPQSHQAWLLPKVSGNLASAARMPGLA